MKNKKGFTLVELLVVIAIIGLLATIAFISLNRARENARNAKRVSDVRQLQSVLELYLNDWGSYPYGASGAAVDTSFCPTGLTGSGSLADLNSSCLKILEGLATENVDVYLTNLPIMPTPIDGCDTGWDEYQYVALDDIGGTASNTTGADYNINFCMSQATGGLGTGAGPFYCKASLGGIECRTTTW